MIVAPVDAPHLAALPELRHSIVELVFVGERIDQSGSHGIFRREWALVEELPRLRFRLLACRRDAAHQLLVHVAIERLGHLAVRGSE